jgi:exopolyphosphatase/guanosine-5'-triphosphate,3'-diphosphate pyrophosphatase
MFCENLCDLRGKIAAIKIYMDKKVAVIDLGTNTFHLLLAEWDGHRYQIIRREHVAAKIGVGGITRGIITEEGISRALEALKLFKAIIEEESVRRVVAFGTSAFRNAQNGIAVAAQIQHQTGIEVNIISGDQEADYIYKGIREAIPMGEQTSLIIDIGGGSVECIIGNSNEIFWKHSFEIGGQRLLERFHQHDPILPEEVKILNDYLSDALKPLLEQIRKWKPSVLIGSSGTFDTLSDIHCARYGLPQQPDAPETPLTFQSFYETFDLLLVKDRADRLLIPGMIEMRVDMIVVACCLIKFLLDHHSFASIRVSSYSLKEGVLATLQS